MVTNNMDALEWLRKQLDGEGDDLLREMVREFAQRLMAAEVDALNGASWGEVSPERVNRRSARREESAGTDYWARVIGPWSGTSRRQSGGLVTGRRHDTGSRNIGHAASPLTVVLVLGQRLLAAPRRRAFCARLGALGPDQIAE